MCFSALKHVCTFFPKLSGSTTFFRDQPGAGHQRGPTPKRQRPHGGAPTGRSRRVAQGQGAGQACGAAHAAQDTSARVADSEWSQPGMRFDCFFHMFVIAIYVWMFVAIYDMLLDVKFDVLM